MESYVWANLGTRSTQTGRPLSWISVCFCWFFCLFLVGLHFSIYNSQPVILGNDQYRAILSYTTRKTCNLNILSKVLLLLVNWRICSPRQLVGGAYPLSSPTLSAKPNPHRCPCFVRFWWQEEGTRGRLQLENHREPLETVLLWFFVVLSPSSDVNWTVNVTPVTYNNKHLRSTGQNPAIINLWSSRKRMLIRAAADRKKSSVSGSTIFSR